MRGSIKLSGKAITSQGRAAQIFASRVVFRWLPVVCSNDLVHGSWQVCFEWCIVISCENAYLTPQNQDTNLTSYCAESQVRLEQLLHYELFRWFVWGSLVSGLIALIPLIDLSSKIFHVSEETDLKALDAAATWVLLILSSVFFTIGSYVFVRAFEAPPKPPLFTYRHFSTDELLAAWLYLFATSPYIPFSMFYINVNPHRYVYWGALIASCFFVAGSAFFVYTCYPSHHHLLVRDIKHIHFYTYGIYIFFLLHVSRVTFVPVMQQTCWPRLYGNQLHK